MHHLAVDDNSGRAHHTVAHDIPQLLHLFQFDRDALGAGDLVDEGNGVFAVSLVVEIEEKNRWLEHGIEHVTHQQNAGRHNANKRGNQSHFQYLAQDDHLGQ
jgi:hypothetical protein